MAKLTNAMRVEILERALLFATDAKEKDLLERIKVFGDKVYMAIVGENLEVMTSMPAGYFKKQSHIDFYHEGGYRTILFTEERLVPFKNLSTNGLMVKSDWPFTKELLSLENEVYKLKETKLKLKKDIEVLLANVTTTDKLRRAWPEVEPFLVGLEAREVYLPMVQISSINDTIAALKEDEKEIERRHEAEEAGQEITGR